MASETSNMAMIDFCINEWLSMYATYFVEWMTESCVIKAKALVAVESANSP
jgi:hypothetical protein